MVKNPPANAGYPSLIPGLGISPGEANGNTPEFLLGKSHGQRSLVGYSPWGCKESGRTEVTWHTHTPAPHPAWGWHSLTGLP